MKNDKNDIENQQIAATLVDLSNKLYNAAARVRSGDFSIGSLHPSVSTTLIQVIKLLQTLAVMCSRI